MKRRRALGCQLCQIRWLYGLTPSTTSRQSPPALSVSRTRSRNQRDEVGEAGAERNVGRVQAHRLAFAVRRRHQAAPRQRDDLGRGGRARQREPCIDHAEARAEDQHGALRARAAYRRPSRCASRCPARDRGCSSWPTASTATWPTRLVPLASLHLHAGRGRRRPRRILPRRCASRAGSPFACGEFVEDIGEIVGIDVARHVDLARIPVSRRLLPLQPAQEMLGIIGLGAHAEGADVEHMVVERRRVGDALPEGRPLLDQRDADVGIGIAQQMGRKEDAAGSSAYDDDRSLPPGSLIRRRSPARRCRPTI